MRHMARTLLRDIGTEPFNSQVRRARLDLGLTLDQASERVNLVYPASRRSIARLEEIPDKPTGNREVLAYVVLLAYGIEPASVGLGGTAAERLINRDRILKILPPINEPRRKFSGRSPSAGSGSSPRRSGWFGEDFARLQLTTPPAIAEAA